MNEQVQIGDTEKAVLACAINDTAAAKAMLNRLTSLDLTITANKKVFDALRELDAGNTQLDILILARYLINNADMKRSVEGGNIFVYLAELNNCFLSTTLLDQYLAIIQDNSATMNLNNGLQQIMQSTDSSFGKAVALKELSVRITSSSRPESGANETADCVAAYLDDLCDAKRPPMLHTGLPKLDNLMGGLPKGSLIIIAARPRNGKTTIALNWMVYNIQHGYKTLFCSLEMSREQILDRVASMITGISYGTIFKQRTTHDHNLKISSELASLLSCDRLNIFDNVRSTAAIVDKIRTTKPDICFIDYAARIRPDRYHDNRHREIESIVEQLKATAIDYNCCVVLLSQINREGTGKPKLENLKESGSLEEGGDMIFLLSLKPEVGKQILSKEASLLIAKHKFGCEGEIPLYFNGDTQRFTEATE